MHIFPQNSFHNVLDNSRQLMREMQNRLRGEGEMPNKKVFDAKTILGSMMSASINNFFSIISLQF